ncbi:MAG: TonB-dependent receptor [Gammaproteobacteria bacterium]|nr:MAG: TonB-dependent receptor [Gammaproteobacteria bacterium]
MNNNYKFFKHSFLALAVMGALSSVANAEEEKKTLQKDESDIERIFVTASKRLTGLQETPIAVTVIGGQDVEQTQSLDLQDLQTIVPTLRVTPLQRSSNTGFAIRGFGNGTNNTGIEPSVGIFIDGVYRSRAAAQIGDLPRLQQIEILSGPQSTLFGKNASAGVINVRTQEPSYDLEGKIEAGIGNYNQRLFKGYITNGITDTFAVSLSGGINTRDGYTDSVVGLGDLSDRDRWNIRGQALYEPNENTKVRLIADYSNINEACCTVANAINGPAAGAIAFLGGTVLDDADPFAYKSALNVDPNNKVDDGGISLQVDIDFDNFYFTSISAYRTNESDFLIDADFTSVDILNNTGNTKIDTYTQEFRLTSTGTKKLDWMVGGFYFNENVKTGEKLFYGPGTRPYFDTLLAAGGASGLLAGVEGVYGRAPGSFFSANTQIDDDFTQDNEAYSFFVNFDYHLNDKLTATFGANYTKDKKTVTGQQTSNEALSAIDFDTDLTVFGVPLSFIPTLVPAIPTLKSLQFLPPQLQFPNSVESGKRTDDQITWTARLAYKLNQNVNFFATAATGFKASSWNLSRDSRPFATDLGALTTAGLIQPNQVSGTRFAEPEDSTVYELGMKSRFDKGTFNITLFDQTIDGFQSSIFKGTGFVLANAGKQSTQGIEFDSVFNPIESISLTFGGILLDPLYDSFVGASGVNGPEDLSGTKPAGIHGMSLTAGITYNFELDNGMYGFVRTDYLYEDKVRLVDNIPDSLTREVNTLNASAGITLNNGVELKLWVHNLTNDEYFMSAFPTTLQTGSYSAYPNQPRTFGATISYEFD